MRTASRRTQEVAQTMKAVTPNDSTPLTNGVARGLFVTVAGNLAFITPEGDTVTLTTVAINSRIDCQVSIVKSTGTTATVLAIY